MIYNGISKAELSTDGASIGRSVQALVLLTDDAQKAAEFVEQARGRAAFAGPVDAFGDLIESWREDGADEIVVPDWHLGEGAEREESLGRILEVFAEVTA